MANGNYSEKDGEILTEILPKVWSNIILESISKASKQIEAVERLRRVEERVENIKQLTQVLSNYMKSNEDDEEEKDADIAKSKLKSIANFFEDQYGGMSFIAPLKVEANMRAFKTQNFKNSSSSSSESEVEDEKTDKHEFLNYVFSESANLIRHTEMQSFKKPVLKKAKAMLDVVKNRKTLYMNNCSTLNLPHGHFPMANLLLIPISINSECVALVGLTNGKYDEFTGDLLSDVLASTWFNLIQDIYSKQKFSEAPESSLKKLKFEKIQHSPIIAVKILNISNYLNIPKFSEFFETLLDHFIELSTSFIVNRVIVLNDILVAVTNKSMINLNACAKIALGMMNFLKDNLDGDYSSFVGVKFGIGLANSSDIVLSPVKQQMSIFGKGVEEVIELSSKGNGIFTNEESYQILKAKYKIEKTPSGHYSFSLME
jgi:hypothetical protein